MPSGQIRIPRSSHCVRRFPLYFSSRHSRLPRRGSSPVRAHCRSRRRCRRKLPRGKSGTYAQPALHSAHGSRGGRSQRDLLCRCRRLHTSFRFTLEPSSLSPPRIAAPRHSFPFLAVLVDAPPRRVAHDCAIFTRAAAHAARRNRSATDASACPRVPRHGPAGRWRRLARVRAGRHNGLKQVPAT